MEAALGAAPLAVERVEVGEEALLDGGVGALGIDLDAGLEPLGENDSFGERGSEAGRDRDPVLGVEAVLVLAAERQLRRAFP